MLTYYKHFRDTVARQVVVERFPSLRVKSTNDRVQFIDKWVASVTLMQEITMFRRENDLDVSLARFYVIAGVTYASHYVASHCHACHGVFRIALTHIGALRSDLITIELQLSCVARSAKRLLHYWEIIGSASLFIIKTYRPGVEIIEPVSLITLDCRYIHRWLTRRIHRNLMK